MFEKFPPRHQVELDRLLDVNSYNAGTYGTKISEAVRITTIRAGVILAYSKSEREEISQIVGLHPDLANAVIRSQNIGEFMDRINHAYSVVRGGELSYQKITIGSDTKESREFAWTQSQSRLKTAVLTHVSKNRVNSTCIGASFYNNNDAHLIFGR